MITDQPFDDRQRWIELGIGRAGTGITRFTPEGQEERIGSFTGIAFVADDVEAEGRVALQQRADLPVAWFLPVCPAVWRPLERILHARPGGKTGLIPTCEVRLMYAPSIQRVLVRQGLLLAAALCILLPGVAAAQKVVTELSPKQMTKILTSMGFAVEDRKDDSEPDEPLWLDLAGYRTAVFLLNQNTDAQLYIGFQQKISAERVNEWNQGHRFARAYRDKDGDAVLEADLDFTGGVTEANVKAWVKLYRDVLGEYVQFIRSEPVARAK